MEQKKVQLEKHYELAIVGCGPAGMAAAVNAKIRNKHFVLLGQEFCSPKLATAEKVDNFLGFPEIKGEELRRRFLDHLKQMQIAIIPGKWPVSIPVRRSYCLITWILLKPMQ